MDESGFITAYGGNGGGNSFAGVVAYVIGILNQLVLMLSALALLMFMWGVFKYIYKPGNKDSRKTLTWGLLTLFILVSIWGILRLACDSFLGIGLCSGNSSSTGQPLNILPSSTQNSSGMPTFDSNFGQGVGQVPLPTPGRPTFTPQ